MAWLLLFLAGLFEIGWAIGMKYSDGFTKLVPSVVTLVSICGSLALLAIAERTIPIGTAYAVWVGIGAVGVALVGMAAFDEPVTTLRIGCLALLVVSIAGLKLTTPDRAATAAKDSVTGPTAH